MIMTPEAKRAGSTATWEAGWSRGLRNCILEEYPKQLRHLPSHAMTQPEEPHSAHDSRVSRQARVS